VLARAREQIEYSLPIRIGNFRERLLRGLLKGRLCVADVAVDLGAGLRSFQPEVAGQRAGMGQLGGTHAGGSGWA
jgi:hypothetical protein